MRPGWCLMMISACGKVPLFKMAPPIIVGMVIIGLIYGTFLRGLNGMPLIKHVANCHCKTYLSASEQILAQHPVKGFSKKEVLRELGKPTFVSRKPLRKEADQEWNYNFKPFKTSIVISFKNDVCVAAQNYVCIDDRCWY